MNTLALPLSRPTRLKPELLVPAPAARTQQELPAHPPVLVTLGVPSFVLGWLRLLQVRSQFLPPHRVSFCSRSVPGKLVYRRRRHRGYGAVSAPVSALTYSRACEDSFGVCLLDLDCASPWGRTGCSPGRWEKWLMLWQSCSPPALESRGDWGRACATGGKQVLRHRQKRLRMTQAATGQPASLQCPGKNTE